MAENAGSRGSYSRAGWAGARYTAAGMTGEVLSDDVFAIYWNPAGLSELKKKRLTETEIREKPHQEMLMKLQKRICSIFLIIPMIHFLLMLVFLIPLWI